MGCVIYEGARKFFSELKFVCKAVVFVIRITERHGAEVCL